MALNDIVGGLRGAVAFLTRIPVPTDEDDWDRFRAFPAAFPIVAYLIGALAALPFLVGGPSVDSVTERQCAPVSGSQRVSEVRQRPVEPLGESDLGFPVE